MSYIEKRDEMRPETGEAPFYLNEVFFSRTDERGIIQAANYVFRRVAGYDWDEILGAPHKIIRHEDMPKAVFWLFWDTIKRGEPIGAYVKNRAKDGLYYWVFAVVTPCPGGYLSARIKPISAFFNTVKEEYANLLAAEKDQQLSPEKSAELLLQGIKELGFDDYGHFAAHALSEELIARDTGMETKPDKNIKKFQGLIAEAKKLTEQTDGLIHEFNSMRTIPNNMRVIASRLEPTGGPISTLSKNYGAMSQEISDWFAKHVVGANSNFSAIKTSINKCMFYECMARILTETANQLDMEQRQLGGVSLPKERQLLNNLQLEYVKKSADWVGQVNDEADRIINACKYMHRQVLGLSTTRVMCKIEGARLTSQGDSLDDIIDQLDTFQTRIVSRLNKISIQAEKIQS